MEQLGYIRASTIPQAVILLNEEGVRSRPLAGGTDLLLLLRETPNLCDRVVDISLIPEMHRIDIVNNQVIIGAAVTFNEAIESPLLQEHAQVLVQACRLIGAVQVRNMGTLGGNIANAAACADSVPALVCLDAVGHVMTPQGEQQWLISDLIKGPNRTLIPQGGLLTCISFSMPLAGTRGVFIKLGRRNAMAISRLTVAAMGRLDGEGRIVEARLVPGSATPRLSRFTTAEEILLGKFPSKVLFEKAADITVATMTQITGKRWSSEYKEPALRAMTVQALTRLFNS